MGSSLRSKTIAFLVAPEGAEQSELQQPRQAVQDEGGTALLISPTDKEVQLFQHLDRGDVMLVDVPLNNARPVAYDALVLPGGVANPDFLRMDPAAVRFVWQFFAAGKPVAAICHAPWLLIEADVIRDRTLTSWPSLRADIRNAGADWVDEEVVVCEKGPNTLITSRKSADLPAFCSTLIQRFSL